MINPADFNFATWPPAITPTARGLPAPIGAVRKSDGRLEVKVRQARGDSAWMSAPRLWWILNRGPVPEGMSVSLVDGNPGNHNPENYALMTAGDRLAIKHMDHPEWSNRQHARAARGTAASNRERGAIERAKRPRPWRWYAVDHEAKKIYVQTVHKKQWRVYVAHGVAIVEGGNGRGLIPIALGWPTLTTVQAFILAILVECPSNAVDLGESVNEIYRRYGMAPPRTRSPIHSAVSALRAAGLMVRGRRGSYRATPLALESRGPRCPVAAVRGCDLTELFNRYHLCNDAGEILRVAEGFDLETFSPGKRK